MWQAKFIVTFWKLAVVLFAVILINWLMMTTEHWLPILLLYASAGLALRTGFGRLIPTHPDGRRVESQHSRQDYIAVAVIEFCNQYAFPILWPLILLLVTLNPFRAEE
ncbi:MAG: hypothetical protein AB1489_43370 [Acidobacteriota bacterium]